MNAAPALSKSWPIQGRTRELISLMEVVTASEPTCAMVSGLAGVGKTRLVAEMIERLALLGVPTALIVGTRAGSTLPLGALAPLLGRPLRADQASLLDLAREALSSLSAKRGFVLFVDDAHLLDDVSAMVVHQLILRGATHVVVTVRIDEPTPDAITALWKDDLVVGVELAALDRAAMVSLVEGGLGGPLEGATGEQLWKASRGNPMMLRELVRGASEGAALQFDHGLWRLVKPLSVSRRLIELVESRLGELSGPERECVELLALGEPLSAHTLNDIVGPAAPIELERRGLVIVETLDARVEVRLAHPLYGEVAIRSLPVLRGGLLRKRLADVVTASGMRRRQDMLRVATWLLDCGEPLPPKLAASALGEALVAQDLSLALRLARIAASTNSPHDVIMLGVVLNELGRHSEAETGMQTLIDEVDLDAEHLAIAVMKRATSLFWGLDRSGDALAVLVDGGNRLRSLPGHEAWAQELIGQRCSFEVLRGNPRVALALGEGVLATAVGRTRVEALVGCGVASFLVGQLHHSIALAKEALLLHTEIGEHYSLSLPGIHVVSMTMALTELGLFAEAEAVASKAYDETLRIGSLRGQAWFAAQRGRIALRRGQAASARIRFEDGGVAAAQVGLSGLHRWCLAGSAMASAILGDVTTAQERLNQTWGIPSALKVMDHEVDRAAAALDRANRDIERARSRLWSAADAASASGSAVLELSCLHDLLRLGVPDTGGLAGRMERVGSQIDGPLAATLVAHARAASHVDARSRAVALSEVSSGFAGLGANGLAWETARSSALDYLSVGDLRSAHRLRRRAELLAQHIEWGVSAGDIPELADITLTDRELEIAKLAAGGVTSRDIASRLFLSVRTVDNHLRRIYGRLGIAGRAELADVLEDD